MTKYNIAVVVVTYNPEIHNLKELLIELKEIPVYISDNASNNIDEIKKLKLSYSNLNLISNNENAGIAVAQNVAIKEIEKNVKYILFLDQDSFISAKKIQVLAKDFKKLQLKYSNLACVAATPDTDTKNSFERVNEVISSGMLISVDALKKIGLMKEEFFIDMVDYEWCWRAINKGYLIIKDNKCHFKHQLGIDEKILGKIPVAPFRLYYVYRNTIYLLKKGPIPSGYKTKLKFKLFKQIIFNCVFCSNRFKRIYYIYNGIIDGKREKLGKMGER